MSLYENGICLGFDCKCENVGNCDTCKLLFDYAMSESGLDKFSMKDVTCYVPQSVEFTEEKFEQLSQFIKEAGCKGFTPYLTKGAIEYFYKTNIDNCIFIMPKLQKDLVVKFEDSVKLTEIGDMIYKVERKW